MRELEHFPNLVAMFFARAREKGDSPFLWAKREGAWRPISWSEAADQVCSLAAGLKAIGLRPGEMVMLVSENRPEWCIADLAIMAAGCVTVPAYTTNTERDHQHILDDSGARAVIVSTQKLARPLLPAAIRSSNCEHVIGIEALPGGQSGNVNFHDWKSLIAAHAPDVATCTETASRVTRDDLACLIYTSGTGGAPRGVMQHHGAILHNVEGCVSIIAEDFGVDEEVFLSFLPPEPAPLREPAPGRTSRPHQAVVARCRAGAAGAAGALMIHHISGRANRALTRGVLKRRPAHRSPARNPWARRPSPGRRSWHRCAGPRLWRAARAPRCPTHRRAPAARRGV